MPVSRIELVINYVRKCLKMFLQFEKKGNNIFYKSSSFYILNIYRINVLDKQTTLLLCSIRIEGADE